MVNAGKSCMGNSEEQSGSECVEDWRLNSGRVNGNQVCVQVSSRYVDCPDCSGTEWSRGVAE